MKPAEFDVETVNINGREFPIVGSRARNDAPAPTIVSAKKKRNKYNAQAVVVNGVRFASQAEADRDAELQHLLNAGVIADLKRQPKFDLIVNGRKVCRYVGDWRYTEMDLQGAPGAVYRTPGADVVEDRKGVLTPAFKIKWALAKALHPEIEWRLS